MEFRTKIEELFRYRKLPELIKLSGIEQNDQHELLEALYALQESIYTLDAHLEGYWTLDEEEMESCWADIYQQLLDVGIEKDLHDDFCHEIYMYEKHEIGQRNGLNILDLELLHFYSVKSCDVKLMRRIIYYKFPALSGLLPMNSWESFDLITEFNDDIEDYYEDLETNNGNRFLLSVQQLGMDHSLSIFKGGLDASYDVFFNRNDVDYVQYIWIKEKTEEVYTDTIELLQARNTQILSENKHIKTGFKL